MENELVSRLHFLNPWLLGDQTFEVLADAHLPKEYIPRLVPSEFITTSQTTKASTKLIIGPRQSGKSTLAWQLLKRRGSPALFLLCEDRLIRNWCREPVPFLKEIKDIVSGPVPIFLEEAQHLEDAGLFIKGLVDLNYNAEILVTGSSSFHLLSKTRESLAGRATRLELYPFGLSELFSPVSADMPAALAKMKSREIIAKQLAIGSYPDVWLASNPLPVLNDLIEAFVLRDASDLFRVTQPNAFHRLLKLAAYDIGNLVNMSTWSGLCGVDRKTVGSYLEIMEQSHIVKRLFPFRGGRRSEISSTPKIYFVDNGLRNHLLGMLPIGDVFSRPDLGRMVENWVFTELVKILPKSWELRYWRSTSKAEVDFVLLGGQRILGVEVKAGSVQSKTLSKSLRSFIDAYEPEEFCIANLDTDDKRVLGDTIIHYVSLDRLPLWISKRTGVTPCKI
jgi:predicted AAA+ superfamily ATPase